MYAAGHNSLVLSAVCFKSSCTSIISGMNLGQICIESRFEADRLSGEKDYSSMKNIRWRLLGFYSVFR